MNITKIIPCDRKDYERHHGPKVFACAYMNREPFVKSLPKFNKGAWNMDHDDEVDNTPSSFEELIQFSIEMFKKG